MASAPVRIALPWSIRTMRACAVRAVANRQRSYAGPLSACRGVGSAQGRCALGGDLAGITAGAGVRVAVGEQQDPGL